MYSRVATSSVKRQALVGGVLGILVAVPAAGCASGDRVSKERYVSSLNAMCKDFAAEEKTIGEPQTLADLRLKEPRILDAFEKTILDRVRTLRAPHEIAARANRLVELADQQRQVLRGLIRAARKNDLTKLRELTARNVALNDEAGSIARRLGAPACGGG